MTTTNTETAYVETDTVLGRVVVKTRDGRIISKAARRSQAIRVARKRGYAVVDKGTGKGYAPVPRVDKIRAQRLEEATWRWKLCAALELVLAKNGSKTTILQVCAVAGCGPRRFAKYFGSIPEQVLWAFQRSRMAIFRVPQVGFGLFSYVWHPGVAAELSVAAYHDGDRWLVQQQNARVVQLPRSKLSGEVADELLLEWAGLGPLEHALTTSETDSLAHALDQEVFGPANGAGKQLVGITSDALCGATFQEAMREEV